MARPITWRNVQVNSGAGAAALGNTAANFGRSAVSGLATFNEQMRQNVATEDERLTNEAISAALSGGPQVSGNRRVDAAALQKSVQSKGTFDELMETSDLTQTGLGIENRMNQFKEKNQDAVFKLDQEVKRANLNESEATTALRNLQTDTERYELERAELQAGLDDTQRENVRALDAFGESFKNQLVQQIAAESGVTNPTQDQINAWEVDAQGRLEGPEGRQALREQMVNLGASEGAWKLSSAGNRDVRAAQIQDAVITARQKNADLDTTARRSFLNAMDNNDFSEAVAGPGGLTWADKETIAIQKRAINNQDNAVQYLNRIGVNVKHLEKEDLEIIDQARAAFPTSSVFGPIVASWVTERGELDRKGLRDALQNDQRDMLLAHADLSAVPTFGGAGGGGDTGGGGGQGPANSTDALVNRFQDVKARVDNEKDLPRNVQDMMMKAFEGKVSKGGKSVLDESVRLRNLNELEDYLDNRDARAGASERAKAEQEEQDKRIEALNKALG